MSLPITDYKTCKSEAEWPGARAGGPGLELGARVVRAGAGFEWGDAQLGARRSTSSTI